MSDFKYRAERGSALIVVLVVLVMISLIGAVALNHTSTELKLAHNSRCYKQNVYRAEAAIMEIAQIMEIESDPGTNLKPNTSSSVWLSDGTGNTPEFSPETEEWVFSGSTPNAKYSPIYPDNESGYTVVFEGLAPGSSYGMNTTRLWQYGVYGISTVCNGETGVVAGYRIRF